jgi:hypothetical protein
MGSTSITMRPWISVESWGPDRLDLVGVGADREIWRKSFDRGDGGWQPAVSSWEELAGQWTQIPGAISWGSGRLDIFAVGTERQMYHRAWINHRKAGGSWIKKGWQPIEGVWKTHAVPVSMIHGRIDVFAIGTDDQMYCKVCEGEVTPGGWHPLRGEFRTAPAAVSWGPTRYDLFAIGMNDHMYHIAWDNNKWTTLDFTSLDGSFKSPPAVVS